MTSKNECYILSKSNWFLNFCQYLNLVTTISTRSSCMEWNSSSNFINISKAILRLNNVASNSLRLVWEPTCYWYRWFGKISTWVTNFLGHEIFTEKVTLYKTVHLSLTSLSTTIQRLNFDKLTHVNSGIKGAPKTAQKSVECCNFSYIKLTWSTYFSTFLSGELLVISSYYWRSSLWLYSITLNSWKEK